MNIIITILLVLASIIALLLIFALFIKLPKDMDESLATLKKQPRKLIATFNLTP